MTFLFPPILSAVVSRLSIYLVLIVAARLLAPDEFGAYGVIATVAGIINALVSGGGDMWLNRFTPKAAGRVKPAPNVWFIYLSLSAMLAIGAAAIGIAVALVVDPLPGYRWPLIVAILGASFAGFAEAMLAIVRATGNVYAFFAIRDVITPLAYLSAVIVLAPGTAQGVLEIYAAVSLAAFIFVMAMLGHGLVLRGTRLQRRRGAWRPVALHTLQLIVDNFSARLASYIDVLVLPAFVALATVGEYRLASQFAVGFVVVQHFVFLGLPWQIRRIGGDSADTGFRAVWERQRLLLVVAVAGLAGALAISEPLLRFVDPRFAAFAPFMHVLLFIRFVDLLWGPQHETLVSNGKTALDALANLAAVAAWVAAFTAVRETGLAPVPASVAAMALASAVGQGTRNLTLQRAGLARVYGHPFGPVLPAAGTAAAVAASYLYL